MFICAGESEQFDFAIPVGIGMVDVSVNLTRLCMAQKPSFFICSLARLALMVKKNFLILLSPNQRLK